MKEVYWTWIDPKFRSKHLGLSVDEVAWLMAEPGRAVLGIPQDQWNARKFVFVQEFNKKPPPIEEAFAFVLRGDGRFIRPEDLP